MHIARKRFGQHFLHDQTIIHRILQFISPQTDEHWVEIGPGMGALTFPLLEKLTSLEVIEIDRDCIASLKKYNKQNLIIYENDILKFDLRALKKDERPLKIIGNLPYNISTPLIFYLLQYADIVSDMVFMLQKEVAERIAAPVNAEHYGRLSVMVQYHCQTQLLFPVSAESFNPPPKVESAIIKITPYQKLPVMSHDDSLFSAIVKQAFCQRRKTLRNSLKKWMTDEQWSQISLSPNLRAENVSVEEFVMLSNFLE